MTLLVTWCLALALAQDAKPGLKLVATFGPKESKMFPDFLGLHFAADGKHLACWTRINNFNYCLWSVETGKRVAELPSGETRWGGMYLTDGGKTLVRLGEGPVTEVWDLAARKKTAEAALYLTHASADGSVFAGLDYEDLYIRPKDDPEVRVYRKDKLWRSWPALAVRQDGYRKAPNHHVLALSPDGGLVAMGDVGRIELWDIKGQKKVRPLSPVPGHDKKTAGWVTAAHFTPDGKHLVVSGGGPRPTEDEYDRRLAAKPAVWVWDVSDGTVSPAAEQLTAYRAVHFINFVSPDAFVAVEEYDRPGSTLARVVHYDLAKRNVTPLTDTKDLISIRSLAVSPDGKKLALMVNDELRVYDVLLPKGGK